MGVLGSLALGRRRRLAGRGVVTITQSMPATTSRRVTLYVLAFAGHCVLSLVPALAARSVGDDEVAIWKGRPATANELDEAFGETVSAAIASWSPWAKEHAHVAYVEDKGRVVLFLADDARGVTKELALVTKTCDAVDALLRFDEPAEQVEEVPEPEFEWETKVRPPAPEVPRLAVMLHTRDEAEYATVLEHAATLEPSLAGWVPYGKTLTGFTLVKPLASGWAVSAKGRVEWDPENEVVHRLTALLVLQRFGEVPYWLLTGVSWHVEIELCKDVYCFPYRDEFVWATEHTAWPKELELLFKEPRESFLPGLVAWKRGTFDAARSKEAWGLARFLAQKEGALGATLYDLAKLRRKEGVRHSEDGTWELIVGWEPSVEQQRAIIARHMGEDFEARAVAEFAGTAPKEKSKKARKGVR
jgi:hypothetical protein